MAANGHSNGHGNGHSNGNSMKDSSESIGVPSDPSLFKRFAQDLVSQAGRIVPNLQAFQEGTMTALNGGIIDDRSYVIEKVVQLAATLPNDSKLRSDLSGTIVKGLWNELQHPPVSYLGDDFKYRMADGSNNNITYPSLGKSGSHYARSVAATRPKPANLPDPALIFDTLLVRTGPGIEHPNGISSTFFHLATIIIHDIFSTSTEDNTRLKSSSYLDLGPLYGHNAEMQATVRTFRDGLLKKDTFAEARLLGQPPGVSALMIAFNRFHNWVVGEMAIINEGNRFSMPTGDPESVSYQRAELKRDNDLFQTGRLVTCGLYVNSITQDYLRTILNMNHNSVDSNWALDPRTSVLDVFDSTGVPKGIGNQVSAEFNMIYRWHAAISAHDQIWMDGFYKEIFGTTADPSNLTLTEFFTGLGKWTAGQSKDPAQWPVGKLVRQADGSFKDSELVDLLTESTDAVAGAFGARNIPALMKAVEILGIEQGRKWNLSTLNELRLFFKLKPHATFLEVNSDPDVAQTLEALYGNVDDIELYVGLQAEEAKRPFIPGSGLCPGFTIATAVLADAVALVRGDRFYTTDYNAGNLTSFGFNAASSDFNVAKGGILYKLLGRAFPGWYKANSVYAQFPFTITKKTREILTSQGNDRLYSFDKPSFVGPPTTLVTWQGAVDILDQADKFSVPWGPHTYQLTGHDYMLSGDAPANTEQRKFVNGCLYKPENTLKEVRRFYEENTTSFLKTSSKKLGNSWQLDIIQDIGNLIHTSFTAHLFHIPLQSSGGGPEAYTLPDLYKTFSSLFAYVFLDLDSVNSFQHGTVAKELTDTLAKKLAPAVMSARADRFALARDMLGFGSDKMLSDFGAKLIDRMSQQGKTIEEVVWTIIPTAAAAIATQAQGWAQMMDLYLSDEYNHHWPAIQRVAQSDSDADFETLRRYALEAYRLNPASFGLLRVCNTDNTPVQDGATKFEAMAGQPIYVDFVAGGRDSARFPDPLEIKLDRPEGDYIHHGWGSHSCLGRPMVTTASAAMLKMLGRLGNLRRAPGPQGEIRSKPLLGNIKVFLAEDGSDWGSFPNSKKVLYDSVLEPGQEKVLVNV